MHEPSVHSVQSIIDALRSCELAEWAQLPDIELYMDQVITYLKRQLATFVDQPGGNLITPSIINNYVKAGIVPRPEKKKYGRHQLSALTMACLLKGVMPTQSIKTLVMRDGHLPDEEYYADFAGDLREVLDREAEFLSELTRGDAPCSGDAPCNGEAPSREQLFQMALCFAMRANADRFVADRLLRMLNPPEPEKEARKPRDAQPKS